MLSLIIGLIGEKLEFEHPLYEYEILREVSEILTLIKVNSSHPNIPESIMNT